MNDEIIPPKAWDAIVGSAVPLVIYLDGARKVIGEAKVRSDGTFDALIEDETFARRSGIADGSLSFGFRKILDDNRPSVLMMPLEAVPVPKLKFRGDEMDSKEYVEGAQPVERYLGRARLLVLRQVRARLENVGDPKADTVAMSDIYVVWFCKTLQNWKALVSTTIPDNMYYELTHDGNKKVTYVDSYQKIDNVEIPDGE